MVFIILTSLFARTSYLDFC